MTAYYNEIDAGAAAWLKRLIAAGKIPAGDVDERSIADVQGSDLTGYTQCHFFAGIGGWPYALQLAGWPLDREVWTGSCPCQPFSSAGKRKGTADSRHLWPEFIRLIAERVPATVFGEQVASPLGRTWLAGVRLEMEELAYKVGAADLCAASVGQKDHPVIIHARQVAKWLAGRVPIGKTLLDDFAEWLGEIIIGAPHIRQRLFWVADAGCQGLQERIGDGRIQCQERCTPEGQAIELPGGSGFWSDFEIIPFQDGKHRRAEPGTFPLADGFPGRVGLLKGYGNAIVPQLAAEFVKAFLEAVAVQS